MKKSDIPNIISFIRVLLIIPVVWFLLQEKIEYALYLFILAGLSDALDGYLARKYNWGSHLGGWLDPLADKAMQVSVYVTTTLMGLLPIWLLVAVILRDIVIVLGGLYYYYKVQRVDASPSMLSKLNTLMQIFLIVAILLHHSILPFPEWTIDTLIVMVMITTCISGLGYVYVWSIRAWNVKKGNAHE